MKKNYIKYRDVLNKIQDFSEVDFNKVSSNYIVDEWSDALDINDFIKKI
jgi:hypothetical protein